METPCINVVDAALSIADRNNRYRDGKPSFLIPGIDPADLNTNSSLRKRTPQNSRAPRLIFRPQGTGVSCGDSSFRPVGRDKLSNEEQ